MTALRARKRRPAGTPIRLIVPFTPGTGIDLIARQVGPKLAERLGRPVVVDNRAGASGNLGTEAVVRAVNDGSTLLVTVNTLVMNRALYPRQKMQAELGVTGWMQAWVDFAQPFRMPDFFLLSGLFLSRTIERPWRSFLDNKVVHYLYFYLLWTGIYLLSKILVGRAGPTPGDWMYEYADMLVNGFAMLWFIVILPVFFVVTRLTRHVSPWLMLPAAVLLQVFPYHNESWLLVGHFCERFVYFYLGYRAAPLVFQWAQWAHGHRPAALAAVLGWGVLNQAAVSAGYTTGPGFALVSGLVGSMAVITVGVLLSRFAAMHWLRYLGEHSIVTYLAFFLPMGALIVVMKRTGLWLDPGSMAALMSLLSVSFALALFWLTRRTPARMLFERPRWARVPQGSAIPRLHARDRLTPQDTA